MFVAFCVQLQHIFDQDFGVSTQQHPHIVCSMNNHLKKNICIGIIIENVFNMHAFTFILGNANVLRQESCMHSIIRGLIEPN